jgi:hypothetical protein
LIRWRLTSYRAMPNVLVVVDSTFFYSEQVRTTTNVLHSKHGKQYLLTEAGTLICNLLSCNEEDSN